MSIRLQTFIADQGRLFIGRIDAGPPDRENGPGLVARATGMEMNMKHILYALIALVATPQASLAGERPRDQQPMCDNAKMPPEAQRTNETFAANMKMPERELMSNRAVDIGWQALSKNYFPEAMRRFNQGRLLDPDNGRVFLGLCSGPATQRQESRRRSQNVRQGPETAARRSGTSG